MYTQVSVSYAVVLKSPAPRIELGNKGRAFALKELSILAFSALLWTHFISAKILSLHYSVHQMSELM